VGKLAVSGFTLVATGSYSVWDAGFGKGKVMCYSPMFCLITKVRNHTTEIRSTTFIYKYTQDEFLI
jgi:hypothetical protein